MRNATLGSIASLLLLAGCSASQELVTTGLPQAAPAVVLTATTTGERIDVEGSIVSTQHVDVDAGPDGTYRPDTREGFRYQILNGADEVLYERTTNGPVLVDAFLDFWGDQAGLDVLAAIPNLGRFQVHVPLLEGGETVRFQLRDANGTYVDAGTYDLADIEDDDLGVHPEVSGFETLHRGGPSENRLDIVILGDGYPEDQMFRFHNKTDRVVELLLSRPPFSDVAPLINIHRVDVPSAEAGASFDCPDCGIRDTAFGSIFAVEAINRLSGSTYDSRALFQVEQWEVARAASVVPWDMAIVLVNSDKFGGMAIHYASGTTRVPLFDETAVHELGHTLGLLGDEYAFDFCIVDPRLGLPPNITDAPESPPWAHWVEPETPLPTPDGPANNGVVGAFAPAYNCGDLYRPRRNCAMNAGTNFCPVCREQLTRRILQYADPVDALVLKGRNAHMDGPLDNVTLEWLRDGDVFATSAPGETVSVGTRPFEVRATLNTDAVRSGTEDLMDTWRFE
jgi:hypothetical protein